MVLLCFGLILTGCSKKGELTLDPGSFSSAPPEAQEKWKAAAENVSKRDYLGAATNLMDLLSKGQQLTADQNAALNQAWLKLGNEAFAAANKGNKNATEAVLKMREVQTGDQRGRR